MFKSINSLLILNSLSSLLSWTVLADDSDICIESNRFSATIDAGECITDWNANTWYEYPDDFQDVLNQVTIYQCPSSNQRIIISNGIPDHRVDPPGGRAPCEYWRAISMPLNPTKQTEKRELPTRGTIAIALNGVPAYGPMESGSENAAEPDDDTLQGAQYWYGHAAGTTWHFHHPYMGNEEAASTDLLGYAMDGFPIYGPVADEDLSTLDECNGVTNSDGSYQYHVRSIAQVNIADSGLPYCVEQGVLPEVNWNYILGCYHGDIDSSSIEDASLLDLPQDCVPESSITSTPSESPSSVVCDDDQDKVTITIQTDGKGGEIYWFLKQFRANQDRFFNVEKSGKGKYADDTLYVEEYCVKQNKCHKFVIKDTDSEDGLCCDFGDGYWRLDLNDEKLKQRKMEDVKKQTFEWGC